MARRRAFQLRELHGRHVALSRCWRRHRQGAPPSTPHVVTTLAPTGLTDLALAGSTVLQARLRADAGIPLEGVFAAGDGIIIDAGKLNEERNFVAGFAGGSVILAYPLAYDHAAGATITRTGETVRTLTTTFRLLFLSACAAVDVNEAAFKVDLEASLLALCDAEAVCTVGTISLLCSEDASKFEAIVTTTSDVGHPLMQALIPEGLTFGVYGSMLTFPTTRSINFDYAGVALADLAGTPAEEAELANALKWKYAAELLLASANLDVALAANSAIDGFTAAVTLHEIGSMAEYDDFDSTADIATEKAAAGGLTIEYGGTRLHAVARSIAGSSNGGDDGGGDGDEAGVSNVTIVIAAAASLAVCLVLVLLVVAHKQTGAPHQQKVDLAKQRGPGSMLMGMALPPIPDGGGGDQAINWNWDVPTLQQPSGAEADGELSAALTGDGAVLGWSDAAGVGAPSPDEYIALGTVERSNRAARLASPTDSNEDGYTDVMPSAGISRFAAGRRLSSMKPRTQSVRSSRGGGNAGAAEQQQQQQKQKQQHYFPDEAAIVEGDGDFTSTINALQAIN